MFEDLYVLKSQYLTLEKILYEEVGLDKNQYEYYQQSQFF